MPPLQQRRQRRERHFWTWYTFRGAVHFTRLTVAADPVSGDPADLQLELRKVAAYHHTCVRAAYHEVDLIKVEETCPLRVQA